MHNNFCMSLCMNITDIQDFHKLTYLDSFSR